LKSSENAFSTPKTSDGRSETLVDRLNRTELWHLSKFVYGEVTYQAELARAGSQRSKILERYEANLKGARRVRLLTSLLLGSMPLFLAVLPLVTVLRISRFPVTPDTVSFALIAVCVSFSVYNIFILVSFLLMGMYDFVAFLRGEYLGFLRHLPLSSSDVQRLTILSFVRLNLIYLAVSFIALPCLVFLLTASLFAFFFAFVSNALCVVFTFFATIIFSSFLNRRIFSSTEHPLLGTIVRAGSIIIFMIAMGGSFLPITIFSSIMEGGAANLFPGWLNIPLSLIPPLSGGYLIGLALLPSEIGLSIPSLLVVTSIVGVLVQAGVTLIVLRKGTSCIRKAVYDPIGSSFSAPVAGDVAVVLRTTRPILALTRQSLRMVSRDISALMGFIMPVILPLIWSVSFTVPYVSFSETEAPSPVFFLLMLFFMLGFAPFLYNKALASLEEGLGGLLASLPLKDRDLVRSRQAVMIPAIQIPVLVLLVVTAGIVYFTNNDLSALVLYIAPLGSHLVLLGIISVTSYLVLFGIFFGKINSRYTLHAVNLERSVEKYIALFGITFAILIGSIILVEAFSAVLGTILGNQFLVHLAMVFIVNGVFIAFLEVFTRKIFKY
jgi:hypothetical protein